MNKNADYEASSSNISALFTEWAQISTETLQNLVEIFLRRVKVVMITKKGGGDIIVPMILDWDFHQTRTGVMVRWPHAFGHMV